MGKHHKQYPQGIYLLVSGAQNPAQMDKYEHRRLRLLELRDLACDGVTARLSDKIDRSASYVSRMLYEDGKPGKKRIGDDMLEVIEKAFGLARGWFDAPLGTGLTAAPQPTPLVAAERGPVASYPTRRSPQDAWPFPSVPPERLRRLESALGPTAAAAAFADIDSLLDAAVMRWERRGKTETRRHSA